MIGISQNTKLEIAVEIMAAKIAKTSKEGYTINDEKMQQLIKERNEMYIGNEDIINKIIKEYGSEIKRDYNNI
ncbi:MAG: hypothetical protein ACLUF5_05300 [Clostridia bacterium]|jgi:hypothetical protein|nr:unknown [Clostridium sp. CAG:798]HBJ12772.1 hypothetical protein [Clostridiales bacterium]